MKFPDGQSHLDWLLKALNDTGVEYVVMAEVDGNRTHQPGSPAHWF